jgi:hypothetical protein
MTYSRPAESWYTSRSTPSVITIAFQHIVGLAYDAILGLWQILSDAAISHAGAGVNAQADGAAARRAPE